MAQKLSITIFVDRTPKNLTFLKTACKKVNKSKRPRKDWASCAILSQSNQQGAIGRSRPSLFRSKLVKNTGSLVFLSLWILNKNTTKGFRKIISGIDQPRLVFFFSCDFSCTFAKFVCKNW